MAELFNSSRSRSLDAAMLLGLALLICVVGVGSFQVASAFHVDPAWVFVAINSLWVIPVVGRRYKEHWPRPSFVAFLAAWMIIHGLLATLLIIRVHVLYWLPIFALEFLIGFWAARQLFGQPRHS